MELPRFIGTGSAPGCVSRRSSIGWRSSSRSSTARPAWRSRTEARRWWSRCGPRKNGRPYCSGCGRPGPAYDRLEERRFEFVPVWGIVVFLAYRMRRVDCKRCGVTVEMVPWCDGKNQLTTTYRWYPGDLGQAAELERGRLDLPHVVGQRLPGGGARGRVGPGAPGPERADGPGRGRGRLEPRAQVFDARLRHRRRDDGCWPWPRSGPRRACVRAWRASANRSLAYESKKHTEWVTAVEFSPDGALLASGDRNNGLLVWRRRPAASSTTSGGTRPRSPTSAGGFERCRLGQRGRDRPALGDGERQPDQELGCEAAASPRSGSRSTAGSSPLVATRSPGSGTRMATRSATSSRSATWPSTPPSPTTPTPWSPATGRARFASGNQGR